MLDRAYWLARPYSESGSWGGELGTESSPDRQGEGLPGSSVFTVGVYTATFPVSTGWKNGTSLSEQSSKPASLMSSRRREMGMA